MKKHVASLAVATALALAGGANAAVISFSDTIPVATTNWKDAFTLGKFDSSLGTLTSVKFSYGGSVQTNARGESLDAAPASVTVNTSAAIHLSGPIDDTLNAAGSSNVALSAFDGAIDFGGTSGFTLPDIIGTDSDTLLLSSGLGAFIGTGTYDIAVDATGSSSATGAGNLITQITTRAGATITVDYTYDAPRTQVPEPGVLGLLGLGMLGLGCARRRIA